MGISGGHRETGETIEAAAVRELYEETGAAEYRMAPVGVYSVTDEAEPEEKRSGIFWNAVLCEITRFDPLPSEFEMEKQGILKRLRTTGPIRRFSRCFLSV